jgi:uncharacterized protein with HEPN domain
MKGILPDSTRIEHINDCIKEIEAALSGSSYNSFYENHVLRIAVVKWLEIIGEATRHISNETKAKNSQIEWHKMIGLRNVVVHEYSGINYEVIWEAATISVPVLKKEIETINLDLNDNFLTN